MANDFLTGKWKLWYKSLDVNHDGTISMADVEESRNKFSDLHELDPEKKKMVIDNFGQWWNKYIFKGKDGEISEKEFVDSLNAEYKADKKKFFETIDKCFDTFFDVIDTNKDRSISEEEFQIAFKAYGHETVALDTNFFHAYKPKDGLVPLRDIVKSWVDFATNDDPKKPNVVHTAFKSGV